MADKSAKKVAATMEQDEELNKLVEVQQKAMEARAESDAKHRQKVLEARYAVDRYLAKQRMNAALEGLSEDEKRAVLADMEVKG